MAPATKAGVTNVDSEREQRLTSDLGANKERVELGEDAEHLVGVASAAESISKARDDLVFNARNSFVVSRLGRNPDLGSLCTRSVSASPRENKNRDEPVETSRTSTFLTLSYACRTCNEKKRLAAAASRERREKSSLGVHVYVIAHAAPLALSPIADPLRLVSQRSNHDLQLMVLLAEVPKVGDPLLQFRMRRVDLDRQELLAPLPRHVSRNGRKLFEAFVPRMKHGRARRHGSFERRIFDVGEALGTEDF
jgi:hypothetical protein